MTFFQSQETVSAYSDTVVQSKAPFPQSLRLRCDLSATEQIGNWREGNVLQRSQRGRSKLADENKSLPVFWARTKD